MFVYPSRFDGLPLTLLEVMAAGVPPIVSSYKALPEVVDYGGAGKVVDSYDAADYVSAIRELREPAERQRLGDAARERVRSHYSEAVTATALGNVYRRAICAYTM